MIGVCPRDKRSRRGPATRKNERTCGDEGTRTSTRGLASEGGELRSEEFLRLGEVDESVHAGIARCLTCRCQNLIRQTRRLRHSPDRLGCRLEIATAIGRREKWPLVVGQFFWFRR